MAKKTHSKNKHVAFLPIKVIGIALASLVIYYVADFLLLPFIVILPPLFVVKIGLYIAFIMFAIHHARNVLFKQPFLFLLLLVLYTSIIMNGLFGAYKEGKFGFYAGLHYPETSSSNSHYGLSRISPIYPLDLTGLAYVHKKEGLTIPEGYRTVVPVTGDGWYTIITHRLYTWTIIQGVLGGVLCTGIAAILFKNYIKK